MEQVPEQIAYLLRFPLFGLFRLQGSVADFDGMTAGQLAAFRERYSARRQSDIRQALRWVAEHPGADLRGLLSGLSAGNEEIHLYLRKVASSLERRE